MSVAQSRGKTGAVVAVVVAVLVWLGWSFWHAVQPQPVRLQGQIEAQQYSVASKVAGRLDQVLVRKGDQIEAGQLVYTILSPELAAKLEQARAGAGAAGAMAQQADKGARTQQVLAAKDQWLKAKAAAELGEKTYRRVENLYKDGVISEQKRDEAHTRWQAARFTESSARQMYLMAKEGARKETRKAAHEKLRMAEGAVSEVESYREETRVHSRHAGEVSQVLLRDGELAPQGFPVVTVVDLNDSWAEFNVREDQLKRFSKGAEFDVEIPALGTDAWRFKVSHIAVMGDFATWRTTDTRKGFDMRTFAVEARPVEPVPGLRPGMSVLVK